MPCDRRVAGCVEACCTAVARRCISKSFVLNGVSRPLFKRLLSDSVGEWCFKMLLDTFLVFAEESLLIKHSITELLGG